MNKRILSLLFIVCGWLNSFGQTQFISPEFSVGLHGGYGVSMVNFNPAISQSIFKGYNGGVIFRFISEKNVGIQTELNYIQKGWTESDEQYSRQLNYLEIPFMTHIYMGKNIRFFINLGPEISYLISDKVLINKHSESDTKPQYQDIQNPFEYGLCGGFGLSFRIKQQIFQLETRVQYSLSDIFSNKKIDYFDNSNNMSVNAGLAWLIQFNKKKLH